MTPFFFNLKNRDNCKIEKENCKKKKRKNKKEIIRFFYIALNENLLVAGYLVTGKIIGRISGHIYVRYNPVK